MKTLRIIIVSVIVSLAVSWGMSALAYFDVSLHYGSRGDAVVELQDFLQDQGLYAGKLDGRFGLGTRKAVIAFQVANELKGDGYFGTLSRAKANTILSAELQPSLDAEAEDPIVLPPAPVAAAPAPIPVIIVPSSPAPAPAPSPVLPQNFVLAGVADASFTYPEYSGAKKAAVIGSFTLKNSSSTVNIRITKLEVSLFDANDNKLSFSSDPSLSQLSSIATTESSGAGMNPVMPMAVNNFDVDMVLYPGQSKQIKIKADIDSGSLVKIKLSATGTSF